MDEQKISRNIHPPPNPTAAGPSWGTSVGVLLTVG
jgi:hypothetical protein